MKNLIKKIKIVKKIGQFCSVPIDLFYPPTCGICGKFDSNFLCTKCKKLLESQEKFVIEKNYSWNENFENLLYIFQYEGMIRNIILEYKFGDKSYLYKTIVNFLLKNEKFFEILKSYDTIVPVPISRKRHKERGYNQSLLIAQEISRRLSIKLEKDCLYKKKNIVPQSTLKKEDRQQNIQGAYVLRNIEKLKDRKIILLDDIYTTGSTVNECCRILQQAHPNKIDVLTIAKD